MFLLLVIRKFRGSSPAASALVVIVLLGPWLPAITARVPLLATCQTRLIQQCRADQFAFWSGSRFQVMRGVFHFGLPRIKAHLAKGFAFLAAFLLGLFGGHHFCVHSCIVVHCLTILHLESNSIFLETRVGFSDFGFFGFRIFRIFRIQLWNKRMTLLPKIGDTFICLLGEPRQCTTGTTVRSAWTTSQVQPDCRCFISSESTSIVGCVLSSTRGVCQVSSVGAESVASRLVGWTTDSVG